MSESNSPDDRGIAPDKLPYDVSTVEDGNGNEVTKYSFDSPEGLMAVANQSRLHASEKPLFAVADNGGGEYRIAEADADVSAHSHKLDGYKAVYSEATGEIWNAVTDEYEIINPDEFIGPLVSTLKERDRTDAFGDVWVRNGGANCYAQILFRETDAIWLPDRGRSDPVRCGFTLTWSHDSGLSVKARGFAQDTACSNSIREVTSGIHVKHAGDSDRVDWPAEWNRVLDEMGTFSSTLGTVIEDAMSSTFFDFRSAYPSMLRDAATDPFDRIEAIDLPGGVSRNNRDTAYAMFNLMGYPVYVAIAATDRLMFRLAQSTRDDEDPRVATVWDAYSALTYALTHDLRAVPGASDDQYHRTAKDLLMNPDMVWQEAEREAHAETRDDGVDTGGEHGTWDSDIVEQSTGEALRTHSERSQELAEQFSN